MSESQIKKLLEAIQMAGEIRYARDLASLGLTMLAGSTSEVNDAWREIEKLTAGEA